MGGEREAQEEAGYNYDFFALLYDRSQHKMVKQLSSSLKISLFFNPHFLKDDKHYYMLYSEIM